MPETWYVVNRMTGEPIEDTFDSHGEAVTAAYWLNGDLKDLYEYGLYIVMHEDEWLEDVIGCEYV